MEIKLSNIFESDTHDGSNNFLPLLHVLSYQLGGYIVFFLIENTELTLDDLMKMSPHKLLRKYEKAWRKDKSLPLLISRTNKNAVICISSNLSDMDQLYKKYEKLLRK